MFTLRPAVEEDLTAIRALVKEGRINPTGMKWTRFVVAETAGGEVIGCGQVKPHRDGSIELASLVVTASWRGSGVARAMIEYLVAAHPQDLYLMCRSSLGVFYERFGFQPVPEAELPTYFRRISRFAGLAEVLRKEGETLLIMKRRAEDIQPRERGEH